MIEELVTSTTGSDDYPFTSIQVDSTDRVHISYYYEDSVAGTDTIYYIAQDATGWKAPEQVDDCGGNDCGNWSDLALDSMDRPHISYHDDSDGLLMYAYWNGTAWQKTMVDDCGGTGYCGKSTSIAIDRNNKPHISYRDGGWDDGSSPNGTATLRYAYLSGSTWQKTEIDTRIGGGDTGLALDRSGTPHITYWEGFYKAPKYATTFVYEGTTYWTTFFVEDRRTLDDYLDGNWEDQGPKIGQRNAIAIDNMGRVQICYSHQATNDIYHAGVLRKPYFPWILFTPPITGMGTTPPTP